MASPLSRTLPDTATSRHGSHQVSQTCLRVQKVGLVRINQTIFCCGMLCCLYIPIFEILYVIKPTSLA